MRALVALGLLALAGCTTTQVHRNPGQGYAPTQVSQVAVYYSAPAKPYESLGVVSAKRYKPGFTDPSVADAIPQLTAAAAQLGANGIIVLQSSVSQSRNVTVEAEAIRTRD
jgi:hypothetical protein